eukprot:755883-Hanusia_phi.AAC.1
MRIEGSKHGTGTVYSIGNNNEISVLWDRGPMEIIQLVIGQNIGLFACEEENELEEERRSQLPRMNLPKSDTLQQRYEDAQRKAKKLATAMSYMERADAEYHEWKAKQVQKIQRTEEEKRRRMEVFKTVEKL